MTSKETGPTTDKRDTLRSLPGWWWLAGLAIAALVVVILAPLASGDPDGLERIATDQEFIESAQDAPYAIIPDYTVPGVDGGLSTILAGLIGVVVVFGVLWVIGKALARRSQEE